MSMTTDANLTTDAGPHWVRTAEEARDLAARLRDPARTHPVIVITVHPGASVPYIDPEDVADEVQGIVPVFVLPAAAAHGLTDGLGDRALSVFYGAGRLYPAGERWLRNPNTASRFLCSSPSQGPRAAEQLVAAALTDAHRAGLLSSPKAPDPKAPDPQAPDPKAPDRQAAVTAKVHGFSFDHQVLVRTDDGRQGVLHTGRLRVDVPAERLLQRGQRVTGTLVERGATPELVPQLPDIDVAEQVRREYPDGACVPALVREVTDEWAEVLLHPDFPVALSDEDDRLTDLVAPGDVVAVDVAWVDGNCLVVLGDERKALDALAILPGGPPWLMLDEPARINLQPVHEQPATEPDPQDDADAAQQLADARAAAELFAEQADELRADRDALRRQSTDLRAELRRARLAGRNRDLPEVFADAEQQFRWEVATTYLTNVAESERPQYPLADFALGRSFLGRLDTSSRIPRHKILQVVVDVLCGRAADLPSRDVRPWVMQGSGEQRERPDGGRAWQASLQVHSGARRLHYWQLPDGSIELDSVGTAWR
jgi:hypothetical protein